MEEANREKRKKGIDGGMQNHFQVGMEEVEREKRKKEIHGGMQN